MSNDTLLLLFCLMTLSSSSSRRTSLVANTKKDGKRTSCEIHEGDISRSAVATDVVLAGYTRSVLASQAEFLVFNVFKGEEFVSRALGQRRKPSALEAALNRRLVNVTFLLAESDPLICDSMPHVEETYLLFLQFVPERNLVAYSDGALATYSRRKEEIVKKILGTTRTWGDWSACSASCGGGLQQRKRMCSGKCDPSEDAQQRSCNTFPCIGILDVLRASGACKTSVRQLDYRRPLSTCRLLHRLQVLDASQLPKGFPSEFALLVTIRSTITSFSSGYLIRILNQDHDMQLGLRLREDGISLVVANDSETDFELKVSVWDGKWHQMSFAVRKNAVTFFLDCKPASNRRLPFGKTNISSMASTAGRGDRRRGATVLIVGNARKKNEHQFEGDVEQMMLSDAPSAAAEQCSPMAQAVMHRSRGSFQRDEFKEEEPQLIQRDAGISRINSKRIDDDDDDDFAFGEGESGSSDGLEVNGKKQLPKHAKKGIPLMYEYESEDDGKDEEHEDMSDADRTQNVYDDMEDDVIDEADDASGGEQQQFEGSGSHEVSPMWSRWSPCSRSCGRGTRSRTSYCADDNHGGKSCERRNEAESCQLSVCSNTTASPAFNGYFTVTPVTRRRTTKIIRQRNFQLTTTTKTLAAEVPALQVQRTSLTLCKGTCKNGGVCGKNGKCVCFYGYYGDRCEVRKCAFTEERESYKRSFRTREVKVENFSCGAWGWKQCKKQKVQSSEHGLHTSPSTS